MSELLRIYIVLPVCKRVVQKYGKKELYVQIHSRLIRCMTDTNPKKIAN